MAGVPVGTGDRIVNIVQIFCWHFRSYLQGQKRGVFRANAERSTVGAHSELCLVGKSLVLLSFPLPGAVLSALAVTAQHGARPRKGWILPFSPRLYGRDFQRHKPEPFHACWTQIPALPWPSFGSRFQHLHWLQFHPEEEGPLETGRQRSPQSW